LAYIGCTLPWQNNFPTRFGNLEKMVAVHKFKIGETLTYRSSLRDRSAAPGHYRIIDYRPSEDGEPLYRIKSELERHDRIARESELTWIR
jgi:hypothetical protein